ncbi:MAG: hypothetical protein RL885_32675 [Planctomycetota bacterium]
MQTNKAFLVVAVVVVGAVVATILFLLDDGSARATDSDVVHVEDNQKSASSKALPTLSADEEEAELLDPDEEPLITAEDQPLVKATFENPEVGRPTFIRTRDTMGNIVVEQLRWQPTNASNEKMPQRIKARATLQKTRKHPGDIKKAKVLKPVKRKDGGESGKDKQVDGRKDGN